MSYPMNFISKPIGARPLRLGFVPLTDAAPLIVGQAFGFFDKYGLRVQLHREPGWATIRDKIIYGELDAAHAVVGLPFATSLGLACAQSECLTGLVLNLHGNAITLSNELRSRALDSPGALRKKILRSRRTRTYTFGVVSAFSSHHFVLRQWLRSARINPDRDVRIVLLPPPQMVVQLKNGHLDGFCVGEPWNTVAVAARVGRWVTSSADLAPGHPEKLLLVRRDFAEEHSPEHEALIAALLEACAYCQDSTNHEEISRLLSRPEYVNVPASALFQGLTGRFDLPGNHTRVVEDFNVFHRYEANEPTPARGGWALHHLQECGILSPPPPNALQLIRQTFRADIFHRACRLVAQTNHMPEAAVCA